MELCKLLPWQATRWLFTRFLFFRGGNRHRKWRWNHLKPGTNLRCWHLIRQNESWVDNFYQWGSQVAVCVIFSVRPIVEICWIRWMVFWWCWTSNSSPFWMYINIKKQKTTQKIGICTTTLNGFRYHATISISASRTWADAIGPVATLRVGYRWTVLYLT